ncbi:MAG: aminoglycoside phosphotransferase family protein [Gammaproteobacteria bacterium]
MAGQVWIFSYKLANNHTSILRFIRNNFNEFEIEKEFPSQNRNKLFLLHKENQRYILKIHRKSKRHSNTEVLVMSNLESQIQTPKLISYNVKSPPRYILMTYCGSRILESDNEKYYYDSGKLIAQISQISLTKSNLKTIKKKKINKIQSFIENTQSHHPYLEYLKLYTKLSSNYFSHGDFSLDQVMVNNEDSITIIDWETACFNYRLADLANALSHSLVIKVSTSHAQAIFAGYTSINTLSDNHEIKFLLGLIWSNLFRSKGNEISLQNPKRLAYLENLVKDRSLEKIFKLDL